jgi:aldehyde dehydrogenase (NAD+)
VNPYDGSHISAAVEVAGPEDIDLAVAAAEAAFKTGPWSTFTGSQRAACMDKLADLITANTKEFAYLDAICMGAPMSASSAYFVPSAVNAFRCKHQLLSHEIT